MGCECFRNFFKRSEPYKEEKKEPLFEPEEDPNAFNYEKAKDIVKQCLLSEDDFYKCFCDDVLSLDKENFKILFEGAIDEGQKEKFCERNNLKNEFIYLINKFENFQTILTQWYKDKKYHKYIIKIWRKFPTMKSLKDVYFNEEEMNNYLNSIDIDYYSWNEDIKNEFKNCIGNSPDIKCCEIENYINGKFPEFKLLLTSTLNYKKRLKNLYDKGMDDYEYNFGYIAKSLISDFVSYFSNNIKDIAQLKGSPEFKKNVTIKINELIYEKFDSENYKENDENNYSYISYNKVQEISNKIRDGDILKILEQGINIVFKTKLNIVGGINVAISLLGLCTSIHELYKCFLEHDNIVEQFKEELEDIRQEFEKHKFIGIIPNNYDEALKKIADAIDKIQDDRIKIINLIERIDSKITEKKKIKKKSIFGIIKNVVQFGAAASGIIITSGVPAVTFSVLAVTNFIRTIHHSKKIVNAKKNIKSFKKTLNEAIELEDIIRFDYEYLLDKYKQIKEQYLPTEYKNQNII